MSTATRPPMPFREEKKNPLATRAKEARHTLEKLLEGLGWPKDEEVSHRCIDRLLQIEEESQ